MNTYLNINSIIDGSIPKEKLGRLDANVQVVDTGVIISTRNIKDIKDLDTGELIYPKGHAKATYMSDGSTVEDAISSKESAPSESGLWLTVPIENAASETIRLQSTTRRVFLNELTSLTITAPPEDFDFNECYLVFTTSSSGMSLSCPSDWMWANGTIPEIEAGVTYELHIINTTAIYSAPSVRAVLVPFKTV